MTEALQETSHLGFGCARLSVAATWRENEAILGAAWDEGVRWFDVARSYSYGSAERWLGRFLGGRRDQATVVTKFGIRPPGGLLARPLVQAAARRAVRALPSTRRQAVSTADSRAGWGDFSVPAARDSLHRSLRALRTDAVDGLLLHEAGLADAMRDDLQGVLAECVVAGTVRRWGTAVTDLGVTERICAAVPEARSIVQVPDSLSGRRLDPGTAAGAGTLVTHSVLASDLPRLRTWLADRPEELRAWSTRTGSDLGDPSVLAQSLLATALAEQPGRVVLFSSRDPGRCRDAARAPAMVSGDQVVAFRELLAAVD